MLGMIVLGIGIAIAINACCLYYLVKGILNEPTVKSALGRFVTPMTLVASVTVAFAITMMLQEFFNCLYLL